MDIIIKEPEDRMLMFTAQVNQDSIARLSKSILDINRKDEELEKVKPLIENQGHSGMS